ncbi:MAG: hypothetical protein QOF89_3800 [Acidobacteriota bacterium]|jgi:hypothetical protein|nr:hypothetical protein [Acidobacteriota bacterium]
MTTDASLSSILSKLEAQIAVSRERQASHGQQEIHHRQQRELYTAELEKLERSLETFQAAAAAALELTSGPSASASLVEVPAPDPDPGRKPRLSRMVELVIETWPAGEPFGIAAITDQVNRRYRNRLRKAVEPRMVSVHLRRLLASGRLAAVRRGRPHHEALYSRRE